MKNALRYLWNQYISMILWVNLVIGVLVIGLNLVFSGTTFFATYLIMYPMFPILFLIIYGYTLTTLYRDLALSFQCRRVDLFWASQVGFLICAVGCTAILALFGTLGNRLLDLPALAEEFPPLAAGLSWAEPEVWPGLLLMGVLLQPIGAALGCLYNKHRVITTIIFVVLILFSVTGTVLYLFLADGTIPLPGWLIPGALGILGVLAVIGEIVYYRSNANAVVR